MAASPPRGGAGIGSPVGFPALRDSALEQRRTVLDRCHEHLVSRSFAVLELATLDLDDCEEIGHQVARVHRRLHLLADSGSERDAEASGEILRLQRIYATVDEAEQASRRGGDRPC